MTQADKRSDEGFRDALAQDRGHIARSEGGATAKRLKGYSMIRGSILVRGVHLNDPDPRPRDPGMESQVWIAELMRP